MAACATQWNPLSGIGESCNLNCLTSLRIPSAVSCDLRQLVSLLPLTNPMRRPERELSLPYADRWSMRGGDFGGVILLC